jgi:transcriptional regulator with XRE-family HTH domain
MTDKPKITEADVRNILAQNLKRLRKKAQLSQLGLSLEANLNHKFINDMENGHKWLSCKTISRLFKALNAEPYQLFIPSSFVEHERAKVFASYIDDFSDIMLKNVADFKSQYLGEK